MQEYAQRYVLVRMVINMVKVVFNEDALLLERSDKIHDRVTHFCRVHRACCMHASTHVRIY